MEHHANPSIACSVTSCTYNCKDQMHCSLGEIKVGCCATKATDSTCTECASFKMG